MKKYKEGDKIGHTIIRSESYLNEKGKRRILVECEDCHEVREISLKNVGNWCKKCGYKHRNVPHKLQLEGQRFGHLLVLESAGCSEDQQTLWKCQCDCGNTKIYLGTLLKRGIIKSCGCKNHETAQNNLIRPLPKVGEIIEQFEVLKAERREKGSHLQNWVYIKCPFCGNTFWSLYGDILNHRKKSCGCLNESSGELLIESLLTNNNIPFEREKQFNTCYMIDESHKSRFDFYVDNKYLIEFDGEQHFKASSGSRWATPENVALTQKRDAFKNQWCKENNIPLIRIPYTHYGNLCIEDLLLETTTFLVKEDENNGNNNSVTGNFSESS